MNFEEGLSTVALLFLILLIFVIGGCAVLDNSPGSKGYPIYMKDPAYASMKDGDQYEIAPWPF